MATAQFDQTISALASGPESLDLATAVANIEGWQIYLAEHGTAGTEAVTASLSQLKQHLTAPTPDPDAIEALLQKLGSETLEVANSGNTSNSSKIMEIGEALSS